MFYRMLSRLLGLKSHDIAGRYANMHEWEVRLEMLSRKPSGDLSVLEQSLLFSHPKDVVYIITDSHSYAPYIQEHIIKTLGEPIISDRYSIVYPNLRIMIRSIPEEAREYKLKGLGNYFIVDKGDWETPDEKRNRELDNPLRVTRCKDCGNTDLMIYPLYRPSVGRMMEMTYCDKCALTEQRSERKYEQNME